VSVRRRTVLPVLAALVAGGCLADRSRPSPVDPSDPARLTAQVLAPRYGATVQSGQTVTVQVQARDLNTGNLSGVGFVARRLATGFPTVDSAVVRFEARTDTIHDFSLSVPAGFPTNTQIDLYAIAVSATGRAHLSEPSAVVVVQCAPGTC
jgi:hypothetical protein